MHLDHHRGGSGEPLVLIHGIGHTWRGWKPMLPYLEQSFDVLAVDLPGFGRSPSLPPGTEATPEALADVVEQAMDHAGFDEAVVCGNSLGGWIALELARRGRATSVVAISPAGLQHTRERGWGRNILLGMRWGARNLRAPDPLLRSALGPFLFAGPAIAGRGGSTRTTSPRSCACSRRRPASSTRCPTRSGDSRRGLTGSTCQCGSSGAPAT